MSTPRPLPYAGAQPFADVAHTPAEHFRLALFGVVARFLEQVGEGDRDAAVAAHPWLADYRDELVELAGVEGAGAALWCVALDEWAARAREPLPLGELRAAGMGPLDLELLLAAGSVEEDPRFGELFEEVQGRERRPTFGLLLAWWRMAADGGDHVEAVRRALLALIDAGLLSVLNPDAPRPEWVLAVPHGLWDCLRGDRPSVRGLTHVPVSALPRLEEYVTPGDTGERCRALPQLLERRADQVVVVRGAAHNGRRTLLGCAARALGRSLLVADAAVLEDDARWRLFGVLATLLHALPVLHAELAPGEVRTLPPLPCALAPLGVITSRHGAWSTSDGRPLLALDLPLPDAKQRARHWAAAAPGQSPAACEALALAARLTSGNLRRAAGAAAGFATLAGRRSIEPSDLRTACRELQWARLETLATRLPTAGRLSDLVVPDETRQGLEGLVARCRHRERLAARAAAVAQGNTGVRALFAGASGTGKTLGARLVAASLDRELYRIDLAATVSKYLGETEKSLDQAFAAAEELDVVLLLDEGDALMANRTDVGSSNDRYANLETNFLLQRVESFDGILLVTSNAPDRIDRAFARRMDVVIHFGAPDEWARYHILKLHLPGAAIADEWLQEVACRCVLSGGQLRNVASQAQLLALAGHGTVRAEHLYGALVREYRKTGGRCPLREADVVSAAAPGRD
jgi:hypothetical protein